MLPIPSKLPDGPDLDSLALAQDYGRHPVTRALVSKLTLELDAQLATLLDSFPAKDEAQLKTKLQEIKTTKYVLLCLTKPLQVQL